MTVLRYPLPTGQPAVAIMERLVRRYNKTFLTFTTEDEIWPSANSEFFGSQEKIYTSPEVANTDYLFSAYDGKISLERLPCSYYHHMRSHFLAALKPIPSLEMVANQVFDQYFTKNIPVGIHVRMHDRRYDWEVVPPGLGSSLATAFGEGATTEHFITVMKTIENHFRVKTLSNENPAPSLIRFFIASNDEKVKKELVEHFPNAISLTGTLSREDPQGIEMALIEWLILSRTELIVNTYGSSFAVEAAYLHNRPLVGIWNNVLIHHDQSYLEFCGHMQYAKYLSKLAIASDFQEGTVDRRTVKSNFVIYVPCDNLENWGLPNVYCIKQEDENEEVTQQQWSAYFIVIFTVAG